MMEDVFRTQNHTVQLLSSRRISQDDQNQKPHYSIPGILHFIQHEWARFEMERAQWKVERAELRARIAFLEGERKGQENLKNDLIRRIKMLEYALKQERIKLHKLKCGTDLNFIDFPMRDDIDGPVDSDPLITNNSNVSWRQGWQLLRQCLQEIDYTDTVMNVRSERIRTLLGLALSNTENGDVKSISSIRRSQQVKKTSDIQLNKKTISDAESALIQTEQSVLNMFDFLSTENVDMDDTLAADDERNEKLEKYAKPRDKDSSILVGRDDVIGEASTNEILTESGILEADDTSSHKTQGDNSEKEPQRSILQAMLVRLGRSIGLVSRTDEDHISSDDLSGTSVGAPPDSSQIESNKNGIRSGLHLSFSPDSMKPLLSAHGNDSDSFDAALGLGELASLTIRNEAATSYDISSTKQTFRKTWTAKYILRSHFDGVRALAFHPVEPVLITASEDHTLKLWNLQKTSPAKNIASLDLQPVYTFRAHIGPVLCLALNTSSGQFFSGGIDGTIRCWNVPSSLSDLYDSFNPRILTATLRGHTDAVWGVSIHSAKSLLLSCSADCTVRLWSPQSKIPLLNTYTNDLSCGYPTSVDYLRCDMTQFVAAFSSSISTIYDMETAVPILQLDSSQTPDASGLGKQINRIVCHPTLPITVTAHEDRRIRFFDNNTGKMIHSMVAHMDAVTSLAIDPNGLYLLSGSHDCSIRLWNMHSKTCVQEVTSHRKKFDEAVFDVAFHPSKPYFASAGADALAKVFV